MKHGVLLFAFLPVCMAAAVHESDVARAKSVVPRRQLTGSNPANIRRVLNAQIEAAWGETAKACAEFTVAELNVLLESLYHLRDNESILGQYEDKDGRAPRHAELDSLVAENALDAALAADHPEVHDAVRDGKCFEAAMQWAHHLPQAAREEWAAVAEASIPLLPHRGGAELVAELTSNGHEQQAARASDVVSCQTGHSASPINAGNWEGYPDWPDEVTYTARGYGPYPFWYAGSASTGDLTGAGAVITSYWSAVQNSERLEHSSCTQDLGGTSGDPCTHLFVGDRAALFGADESWCCWSSTPEVPQCQMSTVERDFYKYFTFHGVSEDYVSESGLYSGPVMNYTMELTTVPGFYFWYYTDLDGVPVEQGEGSCVTPRGCGGVKYMFHQYNRSAYAEANLTDTDKFTFPDVCLNTNELCTISPENLCG